MSSFSNECKDYECICYSCKHRGANAYGKYKVKNCKNNCMSCLPDNVDDTIYSTGPIFECDVYEELKESDI